ncbi:hypothetical protein SAMN05216345_108183 [Cupriavidus sp. YR651]|uniref:type III secretion system inner rod subunit SctI n=1 Tax=Cupriavidus sp. YR651 TaxID=1855315 RepID=UPI000880FCC1|nr:type III secretion system inner rod subunit SctI [Cupriavidus sp. YR651]SDD38153.1 hypothetical protein SAMN05216345_108183 [Cupriavidus sp. YR651]
MSVQMVSKVEALSRTTAVDISPQNGEVESLDDRLRDLFAGSSAATQSLYDSIMADVQHPTRLSAPGALLALQIQLGDYRHEVETVSALTRKGVSLVETLLRS